LLAQLLASHLAIARDLSNLSQVFEDCKRVEAFYLAICLFAWSRGIKLFFFLLLCFRDLTLGLCLRFGLGLCLAWAYLWRETLRRSLLRALLWRSLLSFPLRLCFGSTSLGSSCIYFYSLFFLCFGFGYYFFGYRKFFL